VGGAGGQTVENRSNHLYHLHGQYCRNPRGKGNSKEGKEYSVKSEENDNAAIVGGGEFSQCLGKKNQVLRHLAAVTLVRMSWTDLQKTGIESDLTFFEDGRKEGVR